jgi:hypothetical protein
MNNIHFHRVPMTMTMPLPVWLRGMVLRAVKLAESACPVKQGVETQLTGKT